jgi:hypothetical protein
MGAEHLSNRDTKWVGEARIIGDQGEQDLITALASQLPAHYIVSKRPRLPVYPMGTIVLDAKVTNTLTGTTLFIEKKTGNNGGNAHERVYKFVSEGLKRKVSSLYTTTDNPFFLVFSGQTFQRGKYIDELSLLLEGEQYAIMDPGFTNISQVAQQIMEIV